MRKATLLVQLIVVAALLRSPSASPAQTSNDSSQGSPDRPFGAINAALLSAAHNALGTELARSTVAEPIAVPKPAESDYLNSPHQGTSPTPSKRNEALDAFVQPILAGEGVPRELAAVIQVESGWNPLALSPKGARGLWQLMPDTARRYGLRVDDRLDERADIEKSTKSAARYLRFLYAQFGSWPLALAAYNTGEQKLRSAITRAHSRDFLTLSSRGYLPVETRRYVPSVLALSGLGAPSDIQGEQPRRPKFVYALYDGAGL